MPDPAIPAAKVEAATDAMYRHSRWSCFWSREDAAELALAALRAAAAYDAQQRAAAGPQPVRGLGGWED